MEVQSWKVEWKCAATISGAQYVILDGIMMMQELCADNWDFLQQVFY